MYNPKTLPDLTVRQLMLFVARYVRKHSGPDCQHPLSPEAREETVARILFDWQTADYGEWWPDSDLHAVARWCRWWRLRGWRGDTQSDWKEAKRAAKRARDQRAAGWDETPSTGASADARTPTPLAILIAQEEASRGLRYVSDRQRKARRKPIRARNRRETLLVVEGRYETHTAIRWDRVTVHGVAWRGTVSHRAIGKSRTEPVPTDLCRWALLGRDSRGRFVRQPLPAPLPLPQRVKTPRPASTAVTADPAAYRAALAEYYSSR